MGTQNPKRPQYKWKTEDETGKKKKIETQMTRHAEKDKMKKRKKKRRRKSQRDTGGITKNGQGYKEKRTVE